MTTTEMVTRIISRTKQRDTTVIIGELQSAYKWAANRIFNSENGPDLLSTYDEEITLSVRTRSYDMGANLSGDFLGLKQLWAKLPGDTVFTPMVSADTNSEAFQTNDSETSADTSIVAIGHPVYFDVVNFQLLRVAPALPAATKLRFDYYRVPPLPDPSTNDTLDDSGNDLPSIFHEAIVSKATGKVFFLLDDDRVGGFEAIANSELNDALYVMNRRVQQPVEITPFQGGRRRMVI